MCFVPDADLFKAVRSGRAEVVTSTIERFDETGIVLTGGRHLDADVIVTATGLRLSPFGGIELVVDGADVDPSRAMAYQALMLSGVPNFVFTVGYTNASWTLKADLVAEFTCRLLAHLTATRLRAASSRCATRRSASCPSWTSRPATCSGPSTSCRGRATASRGGCGRAISTTAARSGRRTLEDGVLRFT